TGCAPANFRLIDTQPGPGPGVAPGGRARQKTDYGRRGKGRTRPCSAGDRRGPGPPPAGAELLESGVLSGEARGARRARRRTGGGEGGQPDLLPGGRRNAVRTSFQGP